MSNSESYCGDSNVDIDPSLFILNEKNTLITSNYVETMLKSYGVDYKVKNLDHFQKAMVHTSYQIRDPNDVKNKSKNKNKKAPVQKLVPIKNPELAVPLQERSYERLEFLGDSVLHLILAEYLYRRYENQDEGFMTRLRTKIENSDTLAALCNIIGLNKYVLLSKYIEINSGRKNNTSILEDSFESFMGALVLDAGFNVCQQFMIALMEKELDFAQILFVETNFKDHLLQYFHQMRWEDPTYGVMDISGLDHAKQFSVYVMCRKFPLDDGEMVGNSVESSKKKGEQEAARQALIFFGEIKEGGDSDNDSIIDSDSEEEEDNSKSKKEDSEVSLDMADIEDVSSEEEELTCQYCNKLFKLEGMLEKHEKACCSKKRVSKHKTRFKK
jgi:dsRNA-specific ribonuclease